MTAGESPNSPATSRRTRPPSRTCRSAWTGCSPADGTPFATCRLPESPWHPGGGTMENNNRDHTDERRDRDNTTGQAISPPHTPAVKPSAHIPGGATELSEVTRAMQPETVGDK